MKNQTTITTAALGNFIYRGEYETYLGEYMSGVLPANRDAADDEIGRVVAELYTVAFGGIFEDNDFESDGDFRFEYAGTYHPKFYNFETDSVAMNFCYSDCLKNWMLSSVINNGDFDKFLADNYTNRDGFISFTPNNWDDWFEGYMDNELKCVSALLRFFVEYELTYNDVESYTYDFDEQARTIIMENYTPYEYAVKYDDGCIAIITLEYNEEDGVEEYLARLFDTDGKMINFVLMGDEMWEFNGSVYAAWEYSDIERELTDDKGFGKQTEAPRNLI